MKRYFVLLLLASGSHQAVAQLYEAEGTRVMDLTQKATRMEKFYWSIDSNQLSLKSGEKTYYYDVTSFELKEAIIEMKALDLNDAEVMIRFSPQQKILEYYLKEFGLRYFCDKVTRPKPEVDSAALAADTMPKPDSVLVAEQIAKDTMIHDEADVMPEYPGGKTEMMNYLAKNQRYPAKAKKEGLKGFVQVMAVVEKDGTVKYAEAKKDPGGGLGAEAERLVKTMQWNPGTVNDEPVRVRMPITVSFMPK